MMERAEDRPRDDPRFPWEVMTGNRGGRQPGRGASVGPLVPGQRWNVARKLEVVLRLLLGESLEALSREFGVQACRLVAWRDEGPPGDRPQNGGFGTLPEPCFDTYLT